MTPAEKVEAIERLLRGGATHVEVSSVLHVTPAFVSGVAAALGIRPTHRAAPVQPGDVRRYMIALDKRAKTAGRKLDVTVPPWWLDGATVVEVRWERGHATLRPVVDPPAEGSDADHDS